MTPDAAARLKALLDVFRSIGYPLRVTSTDRTIAKQNELYTAGKTALPGGSSLHNFGRAADVIPGKWGTVRQAYPAVAYVARLLTIDPLEEQDHIHLEFPF